MICFNQIVLFTKMIFYYLDDADQRSLVTNQIELIQSLNENNANNPQLSSTYLKKQISLLENRLEMKFSALNAIKSNESINDDSKV